MVLNWLMDNVYSPRNYWRYLAKGTSENAIIFNWGNVPAGTRMGIQPPNEVKALMKQKIDDKKQLASVTKDFMQRYTKYEQEEEEQAAGQGAAGPDQGGLVAPLEASLDQTVYMDETWS